MSMDELGNVYISNGQGVMAFDPNGNNILRIPTGTGATNNTFAGRNDKILFITGPVDSVTGIKMTVKGASKVTRSPGSRQREPGSFMPHQLWQTVSVNATFCRRGGGRGKDNGPSLTGFPLGGRSLNLLVPKTHPDRSAAVESRENIGRNGCCAQSRLRTETGAAILMIAPARRDVSVVGMSSGKLAVRCQRASRGLNFRVDDPGGTAEGTSAVRAFEPSVLRQLGHRNSSSFRLVGRPSTSLSLGALRSPGGIVTSLRPRRHDPVRSENLNCSYRGSIARSSEANHLREYTR